MTGRRLATSLLLVLASVVTATTIGCGDASDGDGLSSRRLRRNSPPAAGSADDHDVGDTEGENDTDVGNPNADTTPGAPSTPGTAGPQFALTLAQNTPTVALGESVELDISVEPKNGFTGPVTFSVSGLPDGVTATTGQATVSSTSPATAKIKLTAAIDAIATAPNTSSALVISGTSSGVTATANANFKVAPKLTLTIPVNVDALRAASVQYRDEWGAAFGASQKSLRTQQGNGIVVTVFNADSKAHIVHGNGGFAHGNTNAPIEPNSFEMANGAPRTRTLNVGTNANGYPHDGAQGVGASFRIKVEAAP